MDGWMDGWRCGDGSYSRNDGADRDAGYVDT